MKRELSTPNHIMQLAPSKSLSSDSQHCPRAGWPSMYCRAPGGSMRDGLHSLLFSVLRNMFVILYYSLWVGNTFVVLPPAVQ